MLGFSHSRPMPGIGAQCHELRVVDEDASWRIVYRIDTDAIVIVEVFRKSAAKRRSTSWMPAGPGYADMT